jgi:hypothetical protein
MRPNPNFEKPLRDSLKKNMLKSKLKKLKNYKKSSSNPAPRENLQINFTM